MKPVLAVICALLAMVPQRGMSAAGTNDQRAIRTEFVADAVLNREELNAVVALAKACGLDEIASVKTFHHLPSGGRGILVTSAERISGRKVTFDTLEVFREGWAYRPKPAVPAGSKSSGEFWVDAQQRPTAHELTTFSTPRGTIRVQVSSGIPIDMAELIVKAFATGRISYSDEFTRSSCKGVDFSQPQWLGRADSGGVYEISFSGGPNRYKFTVVGDGVRIESVVFVYI